MIRGTGDGGVVDGEDSIKVNVERVPTIIVSTEDTITVRASDEVTLTGAFTRPQNVSNLSYEWDFGDGLIPVSGDIGEGEQAITATHEYTIDRSQPYEARFTVEGETDFGAPLTSSSTVVVYVEPSAKWIIGFLDIPETARTATQALGYIVQGLIAIGIWVVLLSPIWGAIVAIIWFLRRKTSIGMPPRPRPRPEPDSGTAEAEDAPEPDAESGDAEAESGEPRPKLAEWRNRQRDCDRQLDDREHHAEQGEGYSANEQRNCPGENGRPARHKAQRRRAAAVGGDVYGLANEEAGHCPHDQAKETSKSLCKDSNGYRQ